MSRSVEEFYETHDGNGNGNVNKQKVNEQNNSCARAS